MTDISPAVADLHAYIAEQEDRETRARRIATIALRSCGISDEDLPAAVDEHWQDYAERLDAIQAEPDPAPAIEFPEIIWPTI